MTTAFSWTLEHPNDSGDWVRIVWAGRVVVTVAPNDQPQWIKSWTYVSADDARDLALMRTAYWEERGLVLRPPMRTATIEVDPEALSIECMTNGITIGPLLGNAIVALNKGGAV